MKFRSFLRGAGFAAALALTACNNGSSSNNPTGPCTLPSPFQVIYPIPSATNVPDAPQQLVFATSASNSNALSGWNAFLNNVNSLNGSFQTVGTAQQITAGQVPAPAAVPTFVNPQY